MQLLDTATIAAGLGVLQWSLVIAPLYRTDADATIYGTMAMTAQIALVVGVNTLASRGQPVPSRRGFRWFVAAQVAFMPTLVLSTFAALHPLVDWFSGALYTWSAIPMLLAHWVLAGDPGTPAPHNRVGGRALGLNPLALVTMFAVMVAQVVTVFAGPTAATPVLCLTLAAISLLLVARVTLVAAENRRLAQVEASFAARTQEAKTQAVGRLAGSIAHQFNNLMATVLGNAQLARIDVPAASQIQEELADVEAAAQRAAELTSRLLHYSGRQFDHRRPLAVGAEVARLAPRLRDLTSHATIDIAIEEPRDLTGPTTAHVDPAQLEQLVLALTTNALAATPAGGRIRIAVTRRILETPLMGTHLACPEGSYVVVEVSDTGCGVPPDIMPHIFEPYVSTRPAHEGAGLGLAAVYGIVAAHGGGISVTSVPGEGSRFEILFLSRRRNDQGRRHEAPPLCGTRERQPRGWRPSGMTTVMTAPSSAAHASSPARSIRSARGVQAV